MAEENHSEPSGIDRSQFYDLFKEIQNQIKDKVITRYLHLIEHQAKENTELKKENILLKNQLTSGYSFAFQWSRDSRLFLASILNCRDIHTSHKCSKRGACQSTASRQILNYLRSPSFSMSARYLLISLLAR